MKISEFKREMQSRIDELYNSDIHLELSLALDDWISKNSKYFNGE